MQDSLSGSCRTTKGEEPWEQLPFPMCEDPSSLCWENLTLQEAI